MYVPSLYLLWFEEVELALVLLLLELAVSVFELATSLLVPVVLLFELDALLLTLAALAEVLLVDVLTSAFVNASAVALIIPSLLYVAPETVSTVVD